jgi:hypothetical protein
LTQSGISHKPFCASPGIQRVSNKRRYTKAVANNINLPDMIHRF